MEVATIVENMVEPLVVQACETL